MAVTRAIRTPPDSALVLALTEWASEHGAAWLHIARRDASLYGLAAAARGFAPELEVIVLPAWDSLPYDRAQPSRDVTAARVPGLFRLAHPGPGSVLVLTSAAAILQRVPPRARLTERGVRLSAGGEADADWLETTLTAFGYSFQEQVNEAGEAMRHGGGMDLFPAGARQPVRLEIDAGRLVSIRVFDPLDQRSIEEIDSLLLLPVSEAFAVPGEPVQGVTERLLPEGELETLFDYLPFERPVRGGHDRLGLAISLDEGASTRIEDWLETIRDAYETRLIAARASGGTVEPPERLYLTSQEIGRWLAKPCVMLGDEGEAIADSVAGDPAPTLGALANLIRMAGAAGDRVIVGAAEPRRVQQGLRRSLGRDLPILFGWTAAKGIASGEAAVVALSVAQGFRQDGLTLLAAPLRDGKRALASVSALFDQELRVGDLVVEPDHGLAQFTGLETVNPEEAARKCLVLRFAANARLLIPGEEAGQVWRYGSGDAAATRDRLTGEAWLNRRAEVAKEIAATAAAIVEGQAKRAKIPAPRIAPPRDSFARFRRRVPFALTPDQETAISAALEDLGRGRPMERLVCGDVGFGKTEVALHAAMAVALSGRQVAVAVPTTLLACQHLETFRRRCAGFGIRVDALIRSSRSAESRGALKRVAAGETRILVGTHALASASVRFQDLGLVVIDEEQRFGEKHKRALRDLRRGVHTLIMTATPLPRSLQSALVGLFDLSVLTSPPAARQPVRSFVLPFDGAVVRSALLREARRGGQSFLVCPRIEDLAPMHARLSELVPELTITQVHGKSRSDLLDQAMLGFAQGATDVLLSTSIIESGLDIPNANTMLIWRPDRFGLAELHQLRGRVGRGRVRAVAYLLTDPAHELSAPARKRLDRIASLERLGAGFAISAADLDLRGAGDLLGEAQSGHIRLLGSELYGHLLTRAIAEARGEAVEDWRPGIAIDAPAYLSADAIPEPDVRVGLYRRLDRIQARAALDDFTEELEDRFGEMTSPTHNLLPRLRLRLLCRSREIATVRAGPEAVAVERRDGTRRLLPIQEPRPDQRLAKVLRVLESELAELKAA